MSGSGVNGHMADGKDTESNRDSNDRTTVISNGKSRYCYNVPATFTTIFPIVQNLRPICITLFRKCKRIKENEKANERFVDW